MHAPLTPSSVTWYRPNGGDALRMGHRFSGVPTYGLSRLFQDDRDTLFGCSAQLLRIETTQRFILLRRYSAVSQVLLPIDTVLFVCSFSFHTHIHKPFIFLFVYKMIQKHFPRSFSWFGSVNLPFNDCHEQLKMSHYSLL